jgi:pSer/pThr/pTyr-binding forkhead associated (FHA) protein
VPESVLTILKFCFLALLYLFLFRVVRVVVKEMKAPQPVPQMPPGAQTAAPTPAAARPPKPARGRGPGRLRIIAPANREGEQYTLVEELTVGRGGGCGIVLADDSFVSTVHARIFRRDGAFYLEDLGSRNGTLLNGEAVTHAAPLRRGDQVQFGHTIAEAVR